MRDGIAMMEFLPQTRQGLQILMDKYRLTDASSLYMVEDWARFVFLLREEEDRPEYFPSGKWATIQRIESILGQWAKEYVKANDHPQFSAG